MQTEARLVRLAKQEYENHRILLANSSQVLYDRAMELMEAMRIQVRKEIPRLRV